MQLFPKAIFAFSSRRFPSLLLIFGLNAILLTGCTLSSAPSSNRLFLLAEKEGVYTVNERELLNHGLQFEVFSYDHLSLSHAGSPVPYLIEDDHLYFYAPTANGRYSHQTSFWLTGNESGLKLSAGNLQSNMQHPIEIIHQVEQNLIYESRAAPHVKNPWFWEQIPHGQSVHLEFEFPHQPVGEQNVTVNLWGLTKNSDINPDHDVDIWLNGRFLTTLLWDDQLSYEASISLPEGTLLFGTNTLLLDNQQTNNALVDIFYIDKLILKGHVIPSTIEPFKTVESADIQIESEGQRPLLFPIQTDQERFFVAPRAAVLKPQIFSAPLWQPPAKDIDFVIILGDTAWETAVKPLTQVRQAEGLRTLSVSMHQISAQYGNDIPHPTDIPLFLAEIKKAQSMPKPLFVLLVGDAVLDTPPHTYPHPLIPAFILPVTYGGETISDANLGDLDGDGRIDVALGRWPVSSTHQVRQLVQKTLAAETAVYAPHNRLIIDPNEPTFTAVANRLPQIYQTEPQTNLSVMSTYIGHGSLTQWSTQNLQQAFSDNPTSPILLQFSCLTGLFALQNPSLSETLLLSKEGPSHIVAATSLTLSAHQEPFAQALLHELAVGKNGRIGTAFLNAQRTLDLSKPGQQEIHDTFILLGDPTSGIHNQVETSSGGGH